MNPMPDASISVTGKESRSRRLLRRSRSSWKLRAFSQPQTNNDTAPGCASEDACQRAPPRRSINLPSWRILRSDASSIKLSSAVGTSAEGVNDSSIKSKSKETTLIRRALLSFRIRKSRRPSRDNSSPSSTVAKPDEAVEPETANLAASTEGRISTGIIAFRTDFFANLLSKNQRARSRAEKHNDSADPQEVVDLQCQAAVESARAAASHLQPGIRDALVDLKLRNNYQFDSDLVRDCNVEEHRALHCDIEALHAKGKLQGLDVAGILDAAGRADGAKHTPAAGVDGRPLADYMDFDRASLIDSFHSTSTFLSASNPPATAGKSDSGKTPASSSPKGKNRQSALVAMTESKMQAVALTAAKREKHLSGYGLDMASKEEWVRSAMEWPEHQCIGFKGDAKAKSEGAHKKHHSTVKRNSTFATSADLAQETSQRVKKGPARRRASSVAPVPESNTTDGMPLDNQAKRSQAALSRMNPTASSPRTIRAASTESDSVGSDVQFPTHPSTPEAAPVERPSQLGNNTKLLQQPTAAGGGPVERASVDIDSEFLLQQVRKPRGAPRESASGSSDVEFLHQHGTPRGAPMERASVGNDLVFLRQAMKPRGAPRQSASLSNASEFLRQSRKPRGAPQQSASLGTKDDFLRHTGTLRHNSDQGQDLLGTRALRAASETLPQLCVSAALNPKVPGNPGGSASLGMSRLQHERGVRASDGALPLPHSPLLPPPSHGWPAMAWTPKQRGKAKQGVTAAGAQGHVHRGRAPQVLPAIGGLSGSALVMGGR